MFNKNDKIKVKESAPLFAGKTGIVLDANETEAKVQINLDDTNENMKQFINVFVNEDLELDFIDNLLTEEAAFENDYVASDDKECKDKKCQSSKTSKVVDKKSDEDEKLDEGFTEETLNCWLADNDAGYLTQEINESGECPIRDQHGKIIAKYNFKTNQLTESLYDTDTIPSVDGEHTEEVIPDLDITKEDFIHDYLYDENIDDLNDVIPSWEFVQIIATAENVDDETVIQEAIDRGYKMFVIRSDNFERLAVAAKGIEAEDIYEDYADYLQGNPTVTELTRK